MATIDVLDLAGKKVGTLELADEVFGGINEDLLWEAVKHYRAAQRAGTHATKNRKLVSGSGKKLWRHGGTVHGPQPRSYDFTFPKKKLLGALRSALAAKLQDGKLIVVESFELKEAKTKEVRKSLDALMVEKTALLVESGSNENVNLERSSRNIDGVEMLYGPEVHPYHLLRYDRAIFTKAALDKLQNSLKASAPKRKAEVA